VRAAPSAPAPLELANEAAQPPVGG